MYPNEIISGLTLYDLLLCLAIIACFLVLRIYMDRLNVAVKVQQFTVMCGVFAVILGYGSAVLFQAFYNIETVGGFEITKNTGATFYGGLIGGAAVFLLLYFGVGHFIFKGKIEHRTAFFDVVGCIAPGIALAHAIGRIGCLMAGCCHGAKTDAWYGIFMHTSEGYYRYVPVQLFETIFLLLLFAYMTVTVYNKGKYNLSAYLIAYGVWRIFAENLRDDYRGTTIVSSLTPSQLTAIILICVGLALIYIEWLTSKKIALRAENGASVSNADINNGGKEDETSDETTD